MPHIRARIRAQLVADLKAANLPLVGDRVYGSVFHPFALEELPAVCVFPEEEAAQGGTMGSIEREVHMIMRVISTAAEGVEDQLDEIAAAIEAAVDAKVDGLAFHGQLFETRFERISNSEQSVEHMAMDLAYAFRYMTAYANAETVTH